MKLEPARLREPPSRALSPERRGELARHRGDLDAPGLTESELRRILESESPEFRLADEEIEEILALHREAHEGMSTQEEEKR